VEVVSLLLAAGAALEARNHVSAVRDDERASLICLKAGSTPLHSACYNGRTEVVSLLLAAGAALEARNHVSAVRDDERAGLICL
jgi:ankyrin repeat protein